MSNDAGRPSDVELGKRESPREKRSEKRNNNIKPSKRSQVASESSSMQQTPKEPWKITIRINDGKYKYYLFYYYNSNYYY
jgi:hypothetical protein